MGGGVPGMVGAHSGYAQFKGKLAESAETLAACLKYDSDFERAGERLGTYAFLRTSEDQANSDAQRRKGRYEHVATQAAEAASYIRPEIMDVPAEKMEQFLAAPALAEWKLALERVLRHRPHTLGRKEENLLAMQGQMSEASNQIFRQLNDADLKWGISQGRKRGARSKLGHSVILSVFAFARTAQSPQGRRFMRLLRSIRSAQELRFRRFIGWVGAARRLLRPRPQFQERDRESARCLQRQRAVERL